MQAEMNSILVLCFVASVALALPARDGRKDRLEYIDLLKTELKEFVTLKQHQFVELANELFNTYVIELAWISHVEDEIKQFIFTLNYREITRAHIAIAKDVQGEMIYMRDILALHMTPEDPMLIRAKNLVRDFDFVVEHIDYIAHLLIET